MQILQIYVIKLLLSPQERKDNTLKMQILSKPQKESWLDTLKKDFQIKRQKKELLTMRLAMLFVDGISEEAILWLN